VVSGEIHTPDALSKEKVLTILTEYEARLVSDIVSKSGRREKSLSPA
jgi:hypothetical protein